MKGKHQLLKSINRKSTEELMRNHKDLN